MKLRHILPLGLSASMLLLAGCASSTRLQIQRAPELSLPGVKTVKIKEFDVTGDLDLDLVSGNGLLGAVVNAAVDAGANALAAKKDSALQKQNLSNLRQAIAQNGYFTVTDGEEYDAVISGSSYYEVKDDGEEVESKEDGKTRRLYELRRKASTRVRFTVADKAGNVLAASEASGLQTSSASGEYAGEARDRIESWQTLVRKSFASADAALVKKIAPYYVTESRTFESGDDKSFKAANKSAQDGVWEGAISSWRGALGGSTKDKAAAYHNLAIYDEYKGELDSALAKYLEVQKLAPSSSHAADVARTQTRVEEARKLREAEAARAAKAAPAPIPAPVAEPAPAPVAAPVAPPAPAAGGSINAPAKPKAAARKK